MDASKGSKANKGKALDAALGQIERQFGKGTVMRMGDREHVEIPSISTGSLGLDFPRGAFVRSTALSPRVRPR
jgi:RecA/RadA recombinase